MTEKAIALSTFSGSSPARSIARAVAWITMTAVLAAASPACTDDGSAPDSPEASQETLQANKELVRQFVEEVKNQRELDRLGEFFAADYVEHNQTVASFGGGVEGYKAFLSHLFTAFPDDAVTIEDILAEGDLVVYRATETGTHKAEFLGIPATDKSAAWTEIQFCRIIDGKIVEHWVEVDVYGWFQQLGVIPSPEQ